MKRLLAVALLCASFAAHAVDVTITITAPQATRAMAALGKARNLKDGSGNPRAATQAELRQYMIDAMRGLVLEQERADATKAAVDAVTVPAFDPT